VEVDIVVLAVVIVLCGEKRLFGDTATGSVFYIMSLLGII